MNCPRTHTCTPTHTRTQLYDSCVFFTYQLCQVPSKWPSFGQVDSGHVQSAAASINKQQLKVQTAAAATVAVAVAFTHSLVTYAVGSACLHVAEQYGRLIEVAKHKARKKNAANGNSCTPLTRQRLAKRSTPAIATHRCTVRPVLRQLRHS